MDDQEEEGKDEEEGRVLDFPADPATPLAEAEADWSLATSVPRTNRPTVIPRLPNVSSPSLFSDAQPNSSSMEAATTPQNPESVYGQTHYGREGETITSVQLTSNLLPSEVAVSSEVATGLELKGPYGTEHLWVPVSWMDWSDVNPVDGDVDDGVDLSGQLDREKLDLQ